MKEDITMSELLYSSKNAYTALDESLLKAAQEYCEGYKKFLDNCKIERFGVRYAIEIAEKEYKKKKNVTNKHPVQCVKNIERGVVR